MTPEDIHELHNSIMRCNGIYTSSCAFCSKAHHQNKTDGRLNNMERKWIDQRGYQGLPRGYQRKWNDQRGYQELHNYQGLPKIIHDLWFDQNRDFEYQIDLGWGDHYQRFDDFLWQVLDRDLSCLRQHEDYAGSRYRNRRSLDHTLYFFFFFLEWFAHRIHTVETLILNQAILLSYSANV